MQAWNVYLKGKLIDTVFFTEKCDKDYVWESLVMCDDYNAAITVRRSNI